MNFNKYKNYNAIYLGCSDTQKIVKKNIGGLFSVFLKKCTFQFILTKMKSYTEPADFCVSFILSKYFKESSIIIQPPLIISNISESKTQNKDFSFYLNYYNLLKINLENYDLT